MNYSIIFIIFILSLFNCIQAQQSSHPLTLEESEKIALCNNKTIQATKELLEKARQGKLEAYSTWMPNLQAQSQAYWTQFDQAPILDSKSGFMTQLTMTQALFSMDLFNKVEMARLVEQQLCLLLQAAINDTLFQIRSAYYQVVLDKQLIATAKERVDLLTALAKQMFGLYKIGEAILFNVNQSKVAVANAMTEYYDTAKGLKTDKDTFTLVLGFDPCCSDYDVCSNGIYLEKIPLLACKVHVLDQIFLDQGVDNFIFEEGFPDIERRRMVHLFTPHEIFSWERVANSYRPDIALGKNALCMAKQKVWTNEGEYLPTLSLLGIYGAEPTPWAFFPRSSFTSQSLSWGVGLNFNWLLFDSFGREHRILEAKAEEKATGFNFQKTMQNAHADVREQIFEIEEAVSSYVNSKANVKLAEQMVVQAKQQFEIGYITIYDYQISIDALIQAKKTKDVAAFDLITAYYGLRRATGSDLRYHYD